MLFQKPSLRTRVTFEAGHGPARRSRDLPDPRRRPRRPRERPRRGPQPRAVRRRRSSCGPARTRSPIELAAHGGDPGHQRADPARASVPGAGRRVHDARAVRPARRASSSPSSATATTSTTRWRCSGRPSGWRCASPIRPATRPNERIVARARELAATSGRPPVVRPRPARGGPRRRRRLHRRLDVDGPGGRDRGAPRRLRRLPGRRRAARRGRARGAWRCTACPPTAARRSPPR